MADFSLVEPTGWTLSLHSIYSAYMGYFQIHHIPWYERSWGHLFSTFSSFLSFSWPVITLADAETGQAHIVTRPGSLNAFIKMVKTRFGETLPTPPNLTHITPFSNAQRHMRHISDWTAYKKLHATLPAAELAAIKTRLRAGDPSAVVPLWYAHTKTFLSLSFAWSERNERSCLEWGYAAARCGVLDSQSQWPPIPDANYRVGHYVTSEYSSKTINRIHPTYPWAYSFGDTQIIGKSKISQVLGAIITSLASPDSETSSNSLVIVTYGSISQMVAKMEELGIKLPSNVMVLDAQAYERALFAAGRRGAMPSRQPGTTMSLDNIVRDLLGVVGGVGGPIPMGGGMVTPHNTGNEAFLGLMTFQMLVEPETLQLPKLKKAHGQMPPMNIIPPVVIPRSLTTDMSGMGVGVRPASMINRNSMPSMETAWMGEEFGQIRIGNGNGGRSGSRSPGRHLDVEDGAIPRMRTLSGNALRK